MLRRRATIVRMQYMGSSCHHGAGAISRTVLGNDCFFSVVIVMKDDISSCIIQPGCRSMECLFTHERRRRCRQLW